MLDEVIAAAGTRIDGLLTERNISELVEEYFRPASNYAGSTFNSLPNNPPDRITTEDLLAVSLLDTPFGPNAVRWLLGEGADEVSGLLKDIPDNVNLWEAGEDVIGSVKSPADQLWSSLTERWKLSLPGVGQTRAGKLMARKRPRLIPIVDTVVREFLHAPDYHYWLTLQGVLQNDARIARIEDLRPRGLSPSVVPTLRLLDVAIWMRHSKDAKETREEVGFLDPE